LKLRLRQRRRLLSAGPSWKSSMLVLALWAETLLSHCEGAIKKIEGIVKAVERARMVVIHLHLLLRGPLTFSSGEDTPCHPSGLQRQTRVL
jgi:hypothetical protein